MTGQARADDLAVPFISTLPGEAPSGVGSIGSAAARCLALIGLAMLLILVLLPALLSAAGIQAAAV